MFYDFLANRKAHAYTAVLTGAMQTLENAEDLLRILGGNSDSVIFNRKNPLSPFTQRTDFNLRGDLCFPVLDRVLNEGLKNLPKIVCGDSDSRQGLMNDDRLALRNHVLQISERFVDCSIGIRRGTNQFRRDPGTGIDR